MFWAVDFLVLVVVVVAAEAMSAFRKIDRPQRVNTVCGRNAHCCGPPAQIRASAIHALGSHLGCLTSKALRLDVRVPAPVTREPGSASGACFAGPRFPRPAPLAPPAPPPSYFRLCSSASRLLQRGQTSGVRASPATAPRLPGTDRQCAAGQTQDLPVPVQEASAHARVSDHAGSSGRSH
jgi:hypothetical protein